MHGDVQIGQEGTTDLGLVNVSSFLKVLIKKIEIIHGISKNVLNKLNLQSKKWSIDWKGLCVASIQQLSFTTMFFFQLLNRKEIYFNSKLRQNRNLSWIKYFAWAKFWTTDMIVRWRRISHLASFIQNKRNYWKY